MLTIFLIPEPFSLQTRQRFLARFLDEGNLLKSLRHPHIFPVYDATIQSSIAYLVTPYANATPLTRVLKQHGPLSLEQVTPLIRQVADALDYAHRSGVVHGAMSSANVLFSDQHTVQLANFGFTRLLSMQGIVESDHPQVHLMSIAGTFLGVPEYTAPEVIHGAMADARADVYALGILLFEMLTGKPPFSGSDPIEVLAQHFQQPVPALAQMRPGIPPAVDAVIQRALERDPQRRIQSAGDLARELELVQLAATMKTTEPVNAREKALQDLANNPMITSPSMLNWSTDPPTGKQPAIIATNRANNDAVTVAGAGAPVGSSFDSQQANVDPFTWWTNLTASQAALPAADGTYGNGPTGNGKGKSPKKRPTNRAQKQRRRVLAFAAGGAVAVGILGSGGFILAHELQNRSVAVQPTATTPPTAVPSPAATTAPAPTQKPMPKPTHKPTTKAANQPSAAPAPTQAPPTPTPVPKPQHTGTVIGSTGQGAGTAASFTNPADGNSSFLIHLAGGTFVAYEKACTHEGVTVYFSGGKLICPRHNAIFDPANGGKVLQGPAPRPLPSMSVRVNADGTVTTG